MSCAGARSSAAKYIIIAVRPWLHISFEPWRHFVAVAALSIHVMYAAILLAEHTCSVLAALLRNINDETMRNRLLSKFVEEDFAKVMC
jgi:hypothetical protein